MSVLPASLHFQTALLPSGWVKNARVTVRDGLIIAVEAETEANAEDERHAIGLPGVCNLHSHAFQRGMAGLAERRGASNDSFWTWREAMYRFVDRIGPDQLQAIAAMAYIEMLECGFTRVGEFHYLHHDQADRSFTNPAEMSEAIFAAAVDSGIGLTHLPVFYAHAGFGAVKPGDGQRRFVQSVDRFAQLLEAARSGARRLPDAVVGIAPHSLRAVTPGELDKLLPLASDGPIHIHIAEQAKEVEDCLSWSGARPVAWLLDNAPVDARWCLVHATHMLESEAVAMARSGAVAGLCPITEANLGDGIFPARPFLAAGGGYGVGSDSNVLIDMTEELRLLEYGQRLVHRERNILAGSKSPSTGQTMFEAAVMGGAKALGVTSGLSVGNAADIVSLSPGHPSLAGKHQGSLLDAFVFAAGRSAIDCVWRHGVKQVSNGRHRARDYVVTRYLQVLEKIVS